MRTLVRYSWHSTLAIYVGSVLVVGIAIGAPWRLQQVMLTTLCFWCGCCLIYSVAIFLSAALTREGRSSPAPWASGLAVLLKLVVVVTLFGDNIRRSMGRSVDGRPLRARGRTHRTGVRDGDDWSRDALPLEPEPELARVDWLKLAGDEHASVAAFSRLALELIALGAPPRLVAGAHRAALEEVEHAQLCFRVASALAGRPLSAAPLEAATAPLAAPSFDRLARESLVDGVLNEGAAAVAVERLAGKARTPWLREALLRVAEQERAHAAFAAQLVAWCEVQPAQVVRVRGDHPRAACARVPG